VRDRFAQLNYSGKLTLYGVALATTHLVLAGLDVGRFFDLWEAAWPFHAALIGTTSATGAVLHVQKKRREAAQLPPFEPSLDP